MAGGGGGGRGPLVAIMAVVLVLLLGGGIGTWALLRAQGGEGADDRSASPTDSPSDDGTEDEDPTSDPTIDPDEPLTSCPAGDHPALTAPVGGRLQGGGLSVAVQPGFVAPEGNILRNFGWLFGLNGLMRIDERADIGFWASLAVLGTVRVEDGYTGTQQAAQSIYNCLEASAASNSEVTYHLVGDEAATVDGHDAWVLRYRIEIDSETFKLTEVKAVIMVVDTGDPDEFSVFVTGAPTDVPAKLQQFDAMVASLQVD